MIDKTIGHYKITKKLGEGGMGEVYLAFDAKLDRKVALKFLPSSLSQDADARQRLLREAKSASKLNHSNITIIHAVESVDGRDFIVMEYVEGQNFSDYLDAHTLAMNDRLGLVVQVAEGLAKAHQAGVFHRDIKPSNILVDVDGRAKLLDFGLATFRGATRLTQTGTTVGTAAYMSPEQAQSREIDHRSDLFSLGVVLFEAITGRLPFEGAHSAALMYSIVNDQPPPLTRYVSTVAEELQRIVSKALAKHPSERYQSASDFISDLKRYLRTSTSGSEQAQPPRRKMVAVLPFDNLGQVEDEYFADGVTEEIISRLAAVKEIGVISRTSVMQLKGTNKTIREIGSELGVDYVLEGTVRWGKSGQGTSRVRITPQLIRVNDDTHMWADRYDRMIEDIFEVQSDIAEKVTVQLHVTLAEGERRAIEAKPTASIDAYHAYRRGYEYIYNPDSTAENIQIAIQMFEQAVRLDPEYAQAHAYLCIGHANMYWYGWDFTPDRVARAKAALDRAIGLAKSDPETPLAAANFRYHCLLDYDGALEECKRSIQRQPSFAVPLFMSAMIMRRQGRFAEALETCQEALKLDPLRPLIVGETGSTALAMRRYDEATGYYERALALAPDRVQARSWLAALEMQGRGDVARSRRFLEELRHRGPIEAFVEWCDVLFAERDLSKTLAFIERHGQEVHEDQTMHVPKSWFLGEAHRLLGNPLDAKPYYTKAVEFIEPKLSANHQDDRLAIGLAFAYVGLGRHDDASRLMAGVVERTPISRDTMDGPLKLMLQAAVHAEMGDSATALTALETVLNCPCPIAPAYLRIHPYWDKLRGNQEFERLANLPPKVF